MSNSGKSCYSADMMDIDAASTAAVVHTSNQKNSSFVGPATKVDVN